MTNPHEARRRRLRARFLVALAEHGIVARAAREARGARRLFYNWRETDEDFAAAWDKALTLGLAALEDAAMTRALDGAKRTVWYQGKPVGHERRASDAMMMFMLRNRLPDRYGWGPGGRGRGSQPELPKDEPEGFRLSDGRLASDLSDADINRRIEDLQTRAGIVPPATGTTTGGFRESLLGASPDILARAPGVRESGP